MRDTTVQVPKALNVIRIIIPINLLIFIVFSCSSLPKSVNDEAEKYEIIRLKSKEGNTQLVFDSYDFRERNEKIPASALVNGVVFDSKFVEPIPSIYVDVFPKEYNLKFFFIGKQSVSINKLKITTGDSVIIKTYLKDDMTPID